MAGSLFGGKRFNPKDFPAATEDTPLAPTPARKVAVLAGGCFWCTEAVFLELDGVLKVVSGYTGGEAATADYKSVCSGDTGHAEVIEVEYDASKISFGQILKIFFAVAHDPTQLNRQGNDVGTQYRSAIFYSDEEQHRVAASYIRQLDAAKVFDHPIVTRLEPLQDFFEAEGYHQNYAAQHPHQPYIAAVAWPKLEKLRAYFGESLKKG